MARSTPPVSVALEEYLGTRLHLANNTQLNDRSVLTSFAGSLGPIQIGNLTPQHVEAYFLGPGGIHLRMKPTSYNKVRQRVELFLAFCARRGYNRRPLMENVHARAVHHRERLRLSPAQMLRLIDAASNARDRCMIAMAVNLALRAGELTSVRLRDVDLATSAIHVVISKSGFEDHMPISADLAPELRRWLTEYAATAARRLDGSDFLFPAREAPTMLRMTPIGSPTHRPGALRPAVQITKPAVIVQRALRTIGIDIEAGEGFHTLRRSSGRAFFDRCAAAGHDEALRLTSAFLHHSSTQTTEHYLGLKHERIKRDDILRDQPFLTAMVSQENVTQLRVATDE